MSKLLKEAKSRVLHEVIDNCVSCPYYRLVRHHSYDGEWLAICSRVPDKVGYITCPTREDPRLVPREIPKWCPLPKDE